MIATSPIASGTYGYASGTGTATVTVPAGYFVVSYGCAAAGGCTMTIAPGGPNQTAPIAAGSTITVPAGIPFGESFPNGGPLGPGTILQFNSTDAYFVSYVKTSV